MKAQRPPEIRVQRLSWKHHQKAPSGSSIASALSPDSFEQIGKPSQLNFLSGNIRLFQYPVPGVPRVHTVRSLGTEFLCKAVQILAKKSSRSNSIFPSSIMSRKSGLPISTSFQVRALQNPRLPRVCNFISHRCLDRQIFLHSFFSFLAEKAQQQSGNQYPSPGSPCLSRPTRKHRS